MRNKNAIAAAASVLELYACIACSHTVNCVRQQIVCDFMGCASTHTHTYSYSFTLMCIKLHLVGFIYIALIMCVCVCARVCMCNDAIRTIFSKTILCHDTNSIVLKMLFSSIAHHSKSKFIEIRLEHCEK